MAGRRAYDHITDRRSAARIAGAYEAGRHRHPLHHGRLRMASWSGKQFLMKEVVEAQRAASSSTARTGETISASA